MNLDEIITELSTNKNYSHTVFGRFEKRGHYIQEEKGPIDWRKSRYITDEKPYELLFEGLSQDEFKAKVFTDKKPEGTRFILIFNDRQGDTRYDSHTDYHILIPDEDVNKYSTTIKQHPELLIKVFQNVFPEYDRSKGKLSMYPDFKMNDF